MTLPAPMVRAMESGHALLRWWWAQMAGLAWSALARLFPSLTTRLQIYPTDSEWQLWQVRGTQRTPLANESLASPETEGECRERLRVWSARPAMMGLRTEQVMILDLKLPKAAEKALHTAMPLRLLRELPLQLDQFLIDWQVIEKDRAAQQLTVRTWVVRRTDVQRELARAERWGLRIVQVGVDERQGLIARNFLKAHIQRTRVSAWQRDRRLAACAAAIATAILGLTMGQWLLERHQIRLVAAPLHAQSLAIQNLAQEARAAWSPAATLHTVMANPDATDALVALTQAVPATAWIYDASIEARLASPVHLKLIGIAAKASALVQMLESTPQFKAVTLANALPMGGTNDREQFQIMADWQPLSAPAAAEVPAARVARVAP